MWMQKARTFTSRFLVCLAVTVCAVSLTNAQTDEDKAREIIVKGLTLVQQGRYAEAIPYLEVLIGAMPDNANLRFFYGMGLVTRSKQTDNNEEAKTLSAKALEQFKAAKRLGLNDPRNESLIAVLSGDAKMPEGRYSSKPEADKLMNQGENNFAQSKYDEALKYFQQALEIDPNIYEAALNSGDVYLTKKDWKNAEKWYQKAIAINPNRETAYRYSATPFMKQQKYDQARDRYIEAFITEPYSNMSPRGLTQWAEVTGAKLGHPKVDIPKISYDQSGKATTTMNENSLPEASKAWLAYSLTRENWRKEKFAKTFPNEKQYRHTLQEETEAIRSALKSAKDQKLTNSQFGILQKLDDEGLLEAYILMAIPDQGIAEDHEEYLKNNRPKLRQYVTGYVIQK